jgi:hypothetical protein
MEIVGMRALWQIHRIAASDLPSANAPQVAAFSIDVLRIPAYTAARRFVVC